MRDVAEVHKTKASNTADVDTPSRAQPGGQSGPLPVAVAGRLLTVPTGTVAPKLEVGAVDDPTEVEADRVAQSIVAALARVQVDRPDVESAGTGGPTVSRAVALPAPRALTLPAARSMDGDRGEAGEGPSRPVGAAGGAMSAATEQRMSAALGGGSPLPTPARTTLQPFFGFDLGGVKVHTGPEARGLSEDISAKAFTVGRSVFFRDSLPDVSRPDGQALLAHELTHVGQQSTGRAQASRIFGWSKKEKEAKAAKKEQKRKEEAQDQLDLELKDAGSLEAMTLTALADYAIEEPRWDKHSGVATKLAAFTRLITFMSDPDAAAACSTFAVKDVLTAAGSGGLEGALEGLGAYASGAGPSRSPIALTAVSDVTKAVAIGHGVRTLLKAFPDWQLSTALPEKYLLELIDEGLVDDVVAYGSLVPAPLFEAENGADFNSYIEMRLTDQVDPITFSKGALAGKVRNFHRFQKALLEQLELNFTPVSNPKKRKPLTIVLHTALDHNGAFHRDPKLTAVFTNTHINAVMVEGGETLGEYQGWIGVLAKEYGLNGTIDQVMFAGHGNSRVIEMAGTITQKGNKLQESHEAIDLDHDRAAADALFDEVLKHMKLDSLRTAKEQPNRRVLFNACLTNSNAVNRGLSDGADAAKAEIIDYLSKNASLATSFGDRAKGKVNSLGANASIGQVDLIKPGGSLDMVSATDPAVTASKLVYMEQGKEAGGVLRAALETFATNETEALAAMQRRVAMPADTWDDILVYNVYHWFSTSGKANSNRGEFLRKFAKVGIEVSEGHHEASISVSKMFSADPTGDKGYLKLILPHLHMSNEWEASKIVRAVMRQVLFVLTPTATTANELLAAVDDFGNVNELRLDDKRYLSPDWLLGTKQLPLLFEGAASKAKDLLALSLLVGKADVPEAVAYLKTRRVAGEPKLDALPEVPEVPEVKASPAPRAKVEKVPAAPGRPAAAALYKRPAVPEVPDLPELPELAAVAAPPKDKKAKKAPAPVLAPGRPGRPKREKVKEVAAVPDYLGADLLTLLGTAATHEAVLAKLVSAP